MGVLKGLDHSQKQEFSQLSSVPWPNLSPGGDEGLFCPRGEIRDDSVLGGRWGTIQQRYASSLACRGRALCSSEWAGMSIFDVVHPAFPLLTKTLPTLKDALKDGFGEAVVACDMPEPCKFPSLDSCQKRFLWTHKEVDHHHDQSLDREGRWGTTDDFATSLLHFSPVSYTHLTLPMRRTV